MMSHHSRRSITSSHRVASSGQRLGMIGRLAVIALALLQFRLRLHPVNRSNLKCTIPMSPYGS
eukprot:scaffold370716_cov17-Prasinocladus_malaysianus.AAC.1